MSEKIATAEVLQEWKFLHNSQVTPLGTGLINDTFLVTSPQNERFVLQRVHPIFASSVNDDIHQVTTHLVHKDIRTPTLVRTQRGELCCVHQDRVWRLLTYIHGVALDKVDSPDRAFHAGQLVANWHHALTDFSYDYVHVRAGVHDTGRHLRVLEDAVNSHANHRLYDMVAPVADALLKAGHALAPLAQMRRWHAHGDLKLSNLLFDATSQQGLCLVDLDTVTTMPWVWELGDALRSWCNPLGENVTEAKVDRAILQSAIKGYARIAGSIVDQDERDLLVDGLATIATELAARFLGDALNEQYFGWDSSRFATRGEHNLLRAKGQWSLAQDVLRSRDELRALIVSSFG